MISEFDDANNIREGDLLAYIEGEAPPELVRRIESSAVLMVQVTALREMAALFTRALFRAGCPDVDLLLQYEAGLLTGTEAETVSQHLATCPYCSQEADEIRTVSL
jgi:hypothetical protein